MYLDVKIHIVEIKKSSITLYKTVCIKLTRLINFRYIFTLIAAIFSLNISAYSQYSDSFKIWNARAIQLIRIGDNLGSLQYLKTLEPQYIKHQLKNPHECIIYYHILGQITNDLNLHNECIEYALKGISIIKATSREDSNSHSHSYFLEYCAKNYSQIHDYYRTLLYCLEGLSQDKEYINDPINQSGYLNTMGIAYRMISEHEKSIACFERCLQLNSGSSLKSRFNQAYILQNLSQTYVHQNQIDSSLYFLEQSIAIQERYPEIFEKDYFSLYATAANRYLIANDQISARRYFDKASEYVHVAAPATEIAHFHKVKSKILALDDNYHAAHLQLDTAINILSRNLDGNIITIYPEEYFDALVTRLDILAEEYESKLDSILLDHYHSISKEYLSQANSILRRIPSDAIKQVLIYLIKPIYHHAIHSAWLLDQSSPGFIASDDLMNLFESYHAQLVAKEVNRRAWIDLSAIAGTQKALYSAWQNQYDSLLHQSFQFSAAEMTDEAYESTTRALYRTEDSLRAWMAQMSTEYPQLKELEEQEEAISPKESDLVFSNFGSILYFFVTDEEVFISHFDRSGHQLQRILLTDSLSRNLGHWNSELVNPDAHNDKAALIESAKKLHQNGKFIFKQILEPFQNDLSEKLLIIPDGIFTDISFPAINKSIPNNPLDYSSADYLLTEHDIQVHFSVKLLARMIARKNNATYSAFSWVPHQTHLEVINALDGDTVHLPPLAFSKAEGELVADLFNGRVEVATDSLPLVLSKMQSARLLHFGSHIMLNNRFPDQSILPVKLNSGIETTLRPYELFQKNLNNDLVILNACHSGKSKTAMGRGMLSFVNGFARSNVKSVLSSRWAVEDKLGYDFVKNLLYKLDDGQPIASAMRTNQLEFLNSGDPYKSHPFAWASYYLMGDPNVDMRKKGMPWWVWVGGLIILLGLKLFRRKGKRHLISAE